MNIFREKVQHFWKKWVETKDETQHSHGQTYESKERDKGIPVKV
jgi:hypothetical protein